MVEKDAIIENEQLTMDKKDNELICLKSKLSKLEMDFCVRDLRIVVLRQEVEELTIELRVKCEKHLKTKI